MGAFSGLTVDNWISVASSVGTLIAAALAAFSIRELRLQRSQQFQPRIALTTARYAFAIVPSDIVGFDSGLRAGLPVLNVGHGTATDLSIEWSLDLDAWIGKINSLSAQNDAGVGVHVEEGWVKLRYKGAPQGGARAQGADKSNLPYVVPVSANSAPANAGIPSVIVQLVNAYCWSYFKGLGLDNGAVHNPAAELTTDVRINYRDTLGRSFERRASLAIDVLCDSPNDPDSPLPVQVAITPTAMEPPEGYGILKLASLEVGRAILSAATVRLR